MNVFSSLAYSLMRKHIVWVNLILNSTFQMVVTHQKLQLRVSISLILGPAIFNPGLKLELGPVSLVYWFFSALF